MAYPTPIVDCDACERRFVPDPDALVEDAILELVRFLCRHCRAGDDGEPGGGGSSPAGVEPAGAFG